MVKGHIRLTRFAFTLRFCASTNLRLACAQQPTKVAWVFISGITINLQIAGKPRQEVGGMYAAATILIIKQHQFGASTLL